MRSEPDSTDKYDVDEVKRLNAEKWQLDLLALNPSYTCWGPHEDYMMAKGEGWNSPMLIASWKEFYIKLDDRNEVVNFYFAVERASKKCEDCDASGYAPEAKAVSDAFYDFAGLGNRWCDKITLDEAKELVEHNRLTSFKDGAWRKPAKVDAAFVARVNAANGTGQPFVSGLHAINMGILIEQRCKRLGLTVKCSLCDGHGEVYTAPAAHVELVLWLLHPRKGCSRGVEVKAVERADLPAVFAFLKGAADRNAERFAKIIALA